MSTISQECTILAKHIEAADINNIFLVRGDWRDRTYTLVSFQEQIGECLEFEEGNFLAVDPELRRNPVFRFLANEMVFRHKGADMELAYHAFPHLATKYRITLADIEKYAGNRRSRRMNSMRRDFEGLEYQDSLARHLANRLKGTIGTMVLRTSERESETSYVNNAATLPTDQVDTVEEIDLETGRVIRIIREFVADAKGSFKFEGFGIFQPYSVELADATCELKMRIELGYNGFSDLYHISGTLKDIGEADGELTVTNRDKMVWRGTSGAELTHVMNRILQEHGTA